MKGKKVKRTFSFLIAVVLVLSFSLVMGTPVAAAPGTTHYVSTAGNDTSGDGTAGNPWQTIQHAVGQVSSGDTIQVTAGIYDEQVVINKSLTLQGAGATTIIKPSADNLTQVFTGLFWYGGTKNIAGIIVANVPSGSSVTIKNLKVDASLVTTKPAGADYLAGIFYRETGGVVDTVIAAGTGAWSSSDTAYGIYLSAGTNTVSVEITGSTITNFDKNGIEVMGGKLTADINHNMITGRGSITDEVQNGVNVGRDAVATVNYNTISNLIYQPKTWWAAGILFRHYVSPTGKNAAANNNTITNCQRGIIFNNANAWAEGNIVSGGTVGLVGIYAEPDAAEEWTASFVGNTVSGIRDMGDYKNAAIGANTYDSDASLNVAIQGNHLPGGGATDADGISIGVEGADGTIVATIANNTISGWQYGIRLDGALVDAASSSANNNNISGNDVFGVYNGGTGTLNATCNWWGDASGPSGEGPGTGDAVSDNVAFEPWIVVPTVATQAATKVLVYSATLNMDYTVGSCYGPVQIRLAYKKSTGTEWSYTDWMSKTAAGTHAQTLTELDSNTGYQFKAQLKYNETLIEGNTLTFVTSIMPTVTTQAATDITSYSAIVNMSYTAGNLSSVEVRFACKRAADPASFYTTWVSRTADGTYAEVLPGLASRTEYEFKAQLRYDGTMIEGATRRFTTATGASIDDIFCFIATAAYGTPTAEQIDVLREFRDVVLLKSTVGSQFVALYYRLSPPVADFIARSDLLRTLVRELLVDPIVWIVEATGDIWRN
jgi:hypothetical protein